MIRKTSFIKINIITKLIIISSKEIITKIIKSDDLDLNSYIYSDTHGGKFTFTIPYSNLTFRRRNDINHPKCRQEGQ